MRILNIISAALFAMGLACWAIWYWAHRPSTCPFRQVELIQDVSYVPEDWLHAQVVANIHGGYFSLDQQRLRHFLQDLPWVRSVSFDRIWPDRLRVLIGNRHAVARWNDALVDESGTVFQLKPPASASPPLVLAGGAGQSKAVYQLWTQLQALANQLPGRITRLQVGMSVSELCLDHTLKVLMLPGKELQAFARYVRVSKQIPSEKGKRAVSIDLRYPGGLAIRWER